MLLSRHTSRREVIAFVSSTAAAWVLGANAQQRQPIRLLGIFMSTPDTDRALRSYVAAFREELQKLGWREGHNIQIESRWGGLNDELRRRFAEELVALQPDLILSQNTTTTAALLRQTRSIPIIFGSLSDPVGSGFVEGLARPGGNVTGFLNLEASLAGKSLELLQEFAPGVSKVGCLYNPTSATYVEYYLNSLRTAARSLGVEAVPTPVRDIPELERAIAALAGERNRGLLVIPDAYMTSYRAEVTALAAAYRLPAIYPFRFFAEIGGLISYGNDANDSYRRAASYADRILKGEKPAELPVQAPVKFELVINAKTARALNLTIPPTLLARADEVIE